MKAMRTVLLICFFISTADLSFAQITQPVGGTPYTPTHTYTGWTDPALNHNRLLQQRNEEGKYKLIGAYKVIGSSFLFGEKNKGDVFSATEKAYNISVSYNTFNQELEFYSTSNPDKPLVKEPGSLDSFIIQQNKELGIGNPLKFIYGPLLGTSDKSYYLEVAAGERFTLYKRYKSELDYVSTNYVQSELRQFNLEYVYFYADKESKGLKKLKINASAIIKEFKSVKDLSGIINSDNLTVNQEDELRKIFEALNSK
ncbi:MAG: hypothetical protein ABL876_05870 [Chitinophagaceae bacterium]